MNLRHTYLISLVAISSISTTYLGCSTSVYAFDDAAAAVQGQNAGSNADDAKIADTRTRVQKEPGTHIHIPLINIDVDKGPSGVHVKLPFVRVDKDATDGALDVKAPFVRVKKDDANSPAKVDAPFTHVNGVKKEKVVDPPAPKIGEAESVPRMQAEPQKTATVEKKQAPSTTLKSAPTKIATPPAVHQ